MKKYFNQLRGSLCEIFNWHKSRIDCLSNLLLGLISSQTVNLSKIAVHFKNNNKISSNYRRIQNFFKDVSFDFDDVARFNTHQLLSTKKKWNLILDRTNWKFGKTDINILVLSVAYEGIAIPLYYELLDHKGNSDSQIRIKLMQKFISNFGKNRIGCLFGDREFIGSHWLSWLDNQQISYAIRVRNNLLATASNGGETKVSNLFRSVGVHEHKTLKSKQKLRSSSVYLSGARSSDGELLIIASNSNNIADLVSMYGLRWEIENLFQALKTRGFNFEYTHLTDKNKIAKLMALLSIAFVWAHKVGEYRDAKIQKITRKKHGRPQNSYFRYGLDMIVNAIQKIGFYSNDFSLCLKIFNKTTKELKI
jgi:hypothetical protein